MNGKKAVWFCLALAVGSAALLAGCDAVTAVFGLEEEGTGTPSSPPASGSGFSLYVSGTGKDTNTGIDEASPLATLAAAYKKALASTTCKRIVVLSDLSEPGLVTLTPKDKIVRGGGDGFIFIEGKHDGLKIERSTGANDSVLQIQDGAKIVFRNITVNGKIAPHDNSEKANNRAILVTGPGTKVMLGSGAVATGKMYHKGVDRDSDKHGIGIRVDDGGKLMLKAGSAVTDCEGLLHVNGAIHLNEGLLEMEDGSRVYGNTARFGGGVQAYKKSAIIMYGGEISGNKTMESGGGVHIQDGTVVMMYGGNISGNAATNFGGGIATGSDCTVTIKNGIISGNNSGKGGGGIEVFRTAFTMEGGEISGNTSKGNGGGVYLSNDAESTFQMTGGVIYGTDGQASQANTVDAGKDGASLYKSASAQIVNTPTVTGTMDTTIGKS
jgi:hypothetical protein